VSHGAKCRTGQSVMLHMIVTLNPWEPRVESYIAL